mgnify:CR=1 FL=1
MKNIFNESELVFEEKSKHGRFRDLEGQIFNRLTVLGFAGIENKHTFWFCKCECGNITKVCAGGLKSAQIKSCGCFQKEWVKERNTTHGQSQIGKITPTYSIWAAMLQRCQNPNDLVYPHYRGRGVTACERWQKFENFFADMGEKPEGLSIDRIDNDKGYFKDNCRWATSKEQQNNRRNNRHLTFNDKTQTVAQWVDELGFNRTVISARINRLGWPTERALTR